MFKHQIPALQKRKKKNKYNAKSCQCHQKHMHMSGLEAGHCNILHAMSDWEGKKIIKVHTQKKFELRVNGKLITSHYVDFCLELAGGDQVVVESKGKSMQLWVIKSRLFKELYPHIPYHVWKK